MRRGENDTHYVCIDGLPPPRHAAPIGGGADLRGGSKWGLSAAQRVAAEQRNAFWQSIEYDMIMNVNIAGAPSPTEGKVMLDNS